MKSDRSIDNEKFKKIVDNILLEDIDFLHKIGQMGAPKHSN